MGQKKSEEIKISVSIPTYGRKELLKRTLESVFNQTVAPDEIVIVDDRSPGDTWDYIKTLKGVKAYQNKKNLKSIQNYNETFKWAKSEFVVSLASDDLLLSNFIEVWKERIAKAPDDVMAFFSAGYLVDGEDKVKGIVKPFPENRLFKSPNTIRDFWDNFYFYIGLSGWTVYKKEIFDKIGYFSEKYWMACENEMTMKIITRFPVYYCATPLFAYRIHELQAYERHTPEREFEDKENAIKVLLDYEKKKDVKKEFSKENQNARIFVRKPVAFLLAASLYYLTTFKFRKAERYFTIFVKLYPKPIFSFVTFKLITEWLLHLSRQFISNILVRIKFGDRGVLEIT